MKICGALIFILITNMVAAESVAPFKYPKLIECKPNRVVSVNLFDGIAEDKGLLSQVTHTFEYMGNGDYQYPNGYATFVTMHTNQGGVLNLYSGNVTFTVDMYGGRYVGTSSHVPVFLPNKRIVGGSADGTFFEGTCKLQWK